MRCSIWPIYLVVLLPTGISAHHQKVIAVLDAAMAGARGQHQDITHPHAHRLARFAAKHHLGPPAGNAQCLMGVGVEVVVVEYAVTPQRRPAVSAEQRLECSGIVCRRFKRYAI
ncbi:hypothetical protein D3C76_1573420 [compost metagenome]